MENENKIQEKNGLAIGGFVCSLCGLITCGFTSIIGIILSIIGLSKSKKMNGEGKGLAIAGIVSGAFIILVFILIIVSAAIGFKGIGDLVNDYNNKVGQRLVCTKTSTENDMLMDQKIEANFKGNKVDNVTINLSVDLGEKYGSYSDIFKKTFEEQYKDYANDGTNLKVEAEDNKININMTINPSKLTDAQKKELDITSINENKETAKKSLEEDGYTCE